MSVKRTVTTPEYGRLEDADGSFALEKAKDRRRPLAAGSIDSEDWAPGYARRRRGAWSWRDEREERRRIATMSVGV